MIEIVDFISMCKGWFQTGIILLEIGVVISFLFFLVSLMIRGRSGSNQ